MFRVSYGTASWSWQGSCVVQGHFNGERVIKTRVTKLLSYLGCYSSLVFDLLAEPRGLLGNAVGVEAVDLVLDG